MDENLNNSTAKSVSIIGVVVAIVILVAIGVAIYRNINVKKSEVAGEMTQSIEIKN